MKLTGLTIALLPLLGACYAYVPIERTGASPGMKVRARVSATEASRLAPLLRVTDARLITGAFVDSASGALIVEVPTMVPQVGSSFETLHQRVSISRSELVELEARKIDRFRTSALVGAAAIVAGVVIYRSVNGDPGRDRAPNPGGSDLRIPLRR